MNNVDQFLKGLYKSHREMCVKAGTVVEGLWYCRITLVVGGNPAMAYATGDSLLEAVEKSVVSLREGTEDL